MTKGFVGDVTDKTANFTVDITLVRSGHRFTNRGAVGAVTFTLPTPNAGDRNRNGYRLEFYGVADQTITVAAAAGKAVALNNAAATSLAASTGGQKIGALIVAVWHQVLGKWMLHGEAVGVTYTVA
jgi:hypothetical protein